MQYKDEKYLGTVYNDLWRTPEKIRRSGDDLLLGWHFGYYNTDIRGDRQAMLNMNAYISRLLMLGDAPAVVLDAGCGMGGTAIYLARAHPQAVIHGITLGASEIALACQLQERFHLENVEFSQQSYTSTQFPAGTFDVVYALESVSHGGDDPAFFSEMHRVLKPGGRLIILDIFPRARNPTFATLVKNRFVNHEKGCRQRTIHSFQQDLVHAGFTPTAVVDLNEQGHIKHLLLTTIALIALDLYADAKRKIRGKSRSTPWVLARFASLYFLSILSYLTLRFGYFSITAVKAKDQG